MNGKENGEIKIKKINREYTREANIDFIEGYPGKAYYKDTYNTGYIYDYIDEGIYDIW